MDFLLDLFQIICGVGIIFVISIVISLILERITMG